jgi:hypothetical protein
MVISVGCSLEETQASRFGAAHQAVAALGQRISLAQGVVRVVEEED